MTNYNGSAITYDGMGNPLTWRGGMSFTWQGGRQMYSTTATSGTVYRYRYNDDGIRYMKWGNGVTTNYYLDGSTVLAESRTDGTKIVYMHDENGNYVGFILNGTKYYYAFNAQGDVVGIYNSSGIVEARYRYDAWGKVIAVTDRYLSTITDATHPANINPIRYRGYYYDTETGLYYLNSRYYDPTVGRFVNEDNLLSVSDITDKNLYAYCEDDPINKYDPSGHGAEKYDTKYVQEQLLSSAITDTYVARAMSYYGIRHKPGYNTAGGQEIRIAMKAKELYLKDHPIVELVEQSKKHGSSGVLDALEDWVGRVQANNSKKGARSYSTPTNPLEGVPPYELIPEMSYGGTGEEDGKSYATQSMRKYLDSQGYIRLMN